MPTMTAAQKREQAKMSEDAWRCPSRQLLDLIRTNGGAVLLPSADAARRELVVRTSAGRTFDALLSCHVGWRGSARRCSRRPRSLSAMACYSHLTPTVPVTVTYAPTGLGPHCNT